MIFKIVLLACFLFTPLAFGEFFLDDDGGSITVREDGDAVFTYHYAPVDPPEGVSAQYRRSGYIHPLYGLDGEILTEDFPTDHYHHRGVFWGWPYSRQGERKMDIWTLVGCRSWHEKWLKQKTRNGKVVLKAQNRWSFDAAPEDAVIRETVTMEVQEANKQGRAIDFTLEFKNVSDKTFTIQGSQDEGKGYGGFNFRPDAALKPMLFTTAQGKQKEDTTKIATPWSDVSFYLKERSAHSGVAVFQHPENPGYPHPGWILRHYSFLGVSWPHVTAHVLQPGESVTLRYRMYVHRGDAEAAKVETAFEEYARVASK
jgi:hypothetical protein